MDLNGLVEEIRKSTIRVDFGVRGSQFTTYKLGGPIKFCVYVDKFSEIESISKIIKSGFQNLLHAGNVLTIGNGSNLLIDDDGFDGIVFILGKEFESISSIESLGEDAVKIGVGSAMKLPMMARQLANEGIGGLSFYVGIPGTVGGAVAMNAGGHGSQTSDVLIDASILDLSNGELSTYPNSNCGFEYRKSVFTANELIISANFRGENSEVENQKKLIEEIVAWRRDNQPGGRNVGSVFQNPEDVSAGALIDKCGLKGFRIGGASVSEKHANFIQASNDAKARDVLELIDHIKNVVYQTTGYKLKPEVRFISSHGLK